MIENYKNKTIIFFGDSITDTEKITNPNYPLGVGYVNMINNELSVCYADLNIKIINEGINAHKTSDLLARFNTSIVANKPDMVFMFIGINDVWHPYEAKNEISYPDIFARITELVTKIKNIGSKVVLIIPFLFPREPFYDFFEGLRPHFEMLHELYLKYVKENNLNYIDMHEVMKPYSEISNHTLTKDSVHPDVIGHAIIAQAILNYLKK